MALGRYRDTGTGNSRPQSSEFAVRLAYLVPTADIQYISWILQSHDGLAVLETIDAARGEVVLHTTGCCAEAVRLLMEALGRELGREVRLLSQAVVVEDENSVHHEDRAEYGTGQGGGHSHH
ncbi:DUF4911 domain-containing protein [bacterium]|nr:DUF4911 domain-containing protein [candidate division CSSED10-310 bacterium]